MYVFPVFPFQHVGEAQKQKQKNKYLDAKRAPLMLGRFAHIVEEIHQIPYGLVLLIGCFM